MVDEVVLASLLFAAIALISCLSMEDKRTIRRLPRSLWVLLILLAPLAIGVVHLLTAANLEAPVVGADPQSMSAYVGAEALWLGAVLSVAIAYRNWRRWQEELTDRLLREAREGDLDARRRRAEERVRIAHELHDVVSHTLAVVGVHLNVALDTLDAEPEQARAALRLAQAVRGRAMADLKSLVGVLRDDSADEIEAPAARLDRLGELVERVQAAGVTVTLDESGDRSAVPAPVALAAYRIVQEALTNTVQHANAPAPRSCSATSRSG